MGNIINYNATYYLMNGNDYLSGRYFVHYARLGSRSNRVWFDPNKQSQYGEPILSGDELYIASYSGSIPKRVLSPSQEDWDNLCAWMWGKGTYDFIFTITAVRDGNPLATGEVIEDTDTLHFLASGGTYLARDSSDTSYVTSLATDPYGWNLYVSSDEEHSKEHMPPPITVSFRDND